MENQIKIKIERFPGYEYMEEFYAIEGNTYPIKEYLKQMGCQWSPGTKVWYFKAENEEKLKSMIEKIKSIPNINVEIDIKPLPQITILYNSFEEMVQKAEYLKCAFCGVKDAWFVKLIVHKKTNTKLDMSYHGAVITICQKCFGKSEEAEYRLYKYKKTLGFIINRIERVENYNVDDELKNIIKRNNLEYLRWLQIQLSKLSKYKI
jgi:hypothetical protein